MPQAFYILFGSAFTVAVSWAAGTLLLRRLGLRFYRQEERLFAFVLGAACLHLFVFALAAAHLAYKAVFLAAGAAILAWAVRQGAHRPVGDPLPPLPRLWRCLFGIGFAAYAFLYLVNAMAPEISPDGSSYHLGLVARYLRERGFPRITTNMYASLSQGVEMLFVFAFAFGRHSAAALVHCAFTLALPWLMLAHARRFGFASAGAGGALLVLFSPVVGVDGSSAYNDVAVSAILFTLYSLVQIWTEERRPRLLVPIGLVAGFGYAAKYTAFLGLPYAIGVAAWTLWRARRPFLRPLAVIAGCALPMMVPWMAKNWIVVDNPFSPFANRYFPNPHVRISFEQEYIQQMRNYGEPEGPLDIALELTLRGGKLGGMLGPAFVFLPLSVLALRRRDGRRLLLAAALYTLPYFGNIGTRFLLPALPYYALALGIALSYSRAVLPALAVAHAVVSWPHVLRLYCTSYAWRLERVPVAAALRITPEESYLTGFHGQYAVARMVERHVPKGERVFAMSGIPEAYTTRDILVSYQSALNNQIVDMLYTAMFPDYAPKSRTEFRFPPRRLRGVRVVQTAGGTDQWNVTEMRVFAGDQELPRESQWRLRAHPNPWDVRYAFDNSPVTRWRSWQEIFPGMFVEADFGAPREVDAVLLEMMRDYSQVVLRLDGLGEDGRWSPLTATARDFEAEPPKGLRRAANYELRALGVRYLLINDSEGVAQDLMRNARRWGITQLAEYAGTRLYRLEDIESKEAGP